MAEYSNSVIQNIVAGGNAIFTNEPSPCTRGYIFHRDDSGIFTVRGVVNNACANYARYTINFGANIAVPTGGTAGAIQVAVAIDGEPIPSSTMIVTPAAVDEYFNVARSIEIAVPRGCCYVVAIENTSGQAINMQNANIQIFRTA